MIYHPGGAFAQIRFRGTHADASPAYERMKRVPDATILRALEKYSREVKGVSRLLFVNRHGNDEPPWLGSSIYGFASEPGLAQAV